MRIVYRGCLRIVFFSILIIAIIVFAIYGLVELNNYYPTLAKILSILLFAPIVYRITRKRKH